MATVALIRRGSVEIAPVGDDWRERVPGNAEIIYRRVSRELDDLDRQAEREARATWRMRQN